MGYILRNDLHMRKDVDRVAIYQHDITEPGVYLDSFGWRLIHPTVAILICLFDGHKSTEKVIEEFQFLTDMPLPEATKFVLDVLENNRDIMVEYTGARLYRPHYSPEDFLMDGDKLDFSSQRLKAPIGAVWIVTLKCPFRCAYCYADVDGDLAQQFREMSLAEAAVVIDQFKELELARIGISGGDPFASANIMHILRMLVEAGFSPEVPTKTVLPDDTIREMKDMGLLSFQYSLDDPLDSRVIERHLNIAADGYLDRVSRSIAFARGIGLKVGINAVLTTHNIDHVAEMIRHYGELGNVYRLNLSQAAGSIFRSFPEIMADGSKYREVEAIIDQLKPRYPHMAVNVSWLQDPREMTPREKAEFFRTRPRCSGGRWEFTILPNGDMSLCEQLYYYPHMIVGNVLKTPIRELWNSERLRSIIYPDQSTIAEGPCRDCDFWDECNSGKGRCWVRAMKAFHDRKDPHNWPDPYCPEAPQPNIRIS